MFGCTIACQLVKTVCRCELLLLLCKMGKPININIETMAPASGNHPKSWFWAKARESNQGRDLDFVLIITRDKKI